MRNLDTSFDFDEIYRAWRPGTPQLVGEGLTQDAAIGALVALEATLPGGGYIGRTYHYLPRPAQQAVRQWVRAGALRVADHGLVVAS